jgi:uncharacterized membrane protein
MTIKVFRDSIFKNAIIVIILVLISFLYTSSIFAQDFTINSFHSDIIIHEDSAFTVKETIEVEFHRPRHGIYREIPFKYTDELGNTFRTPLDVLSVTDEAGKDWKYTAKRSGNAINIRIGDAKKYVSGKQSYVITYSVENAILFFEDHDELYWNVTGNYWNAPIRKASANVNLAVKSKSTNLWASCYTGSFGSRESRCGFDTSGNIAGFFSRKMFAAGEGLTIAFGWDKGLVSQPPSWKNFLWALHLKENWVFLLPVFSLIFMINLWNSRGRDPKVRESVTVMYEPPKYKDFPLTPAEVGAMLDEKLDARDITSTIVGLAVKGYIKIEETKKEGMVFDSTDYYLARLKGPDDNLSQFEKMLMGKIFSDSIPGIMVSDMKNKFYTNLNILKETLYGEIIRKGYFLRNPESVRALYIAAGVIIMIVAGSAAGFISPYSMGKNIIAGILTGIPVLAFSRVMPAKTKAGAAVYIDILGFQEFMNRAEKDRLERMGDKELFSKFLPYAIALDVADNWAKAFEGIYQEPPQWYVSQGGFAAFSPHGFSGSISSMASSLGSVMYSTPRGSGVGGSSGGSGGGGSSGGGFGGGGGGSW